MEINSKVIEVIDKTYNNEFVYNDQKEKKQVLNKIISNLMNCDEFLFSVAFITESGLAKLKLQLHELERKGIKGKILTTNYLNFSEPKALKSLLKFSNIEVKMVYLETNDNYGYHTKGYIFRKDDNYRILIGSSNLTQNALTINKEWNTIIKGTKNDDSISDVLSEFNKMWNHSHSIYVKDIIDKYEKDYLIVEHKIIENKLNLKVIKPNTMQNIVISRLNELINHDQKRGLLISATGTGKTYASAFAIKNISKFKPKKVLFICHRETILHQAEETYNNVFKDEIKSCIFSQNNKELQGFNYIFATFNMLIKDEYLHKFQKNEFDVIVIDEVHRVGDNKYQKIINYFTPYFLLGMSATPDRSDNYDLYKLFDHNIIYEIRLMNALEANMLVPFNYYGVTDLSIDNKPIDDLSDFNKLNSNERIKNIKNTLELYGFSGNRVKGLMFVNSIENGKQLSYLLNQNGYKTKFLDGSNSIYEREEAIRLLSKNDISDGNYLDYILTVDIFNEGVDIPCVNQIVLLRPTMSSIIFIQQLGRGLRLYDDKEYTNIIDFIGNYKNNYCIAEAFNQGRSSKEEIIKGINDILPGASTINIEEIAKEYIYKSIDKAKINSKKDIYDKYIEVKHRLNKIPTLIELYENSNLECRVFLDLQKYKSYYEFLLEKDDEYKIIFNNEQTNIINYLSRFVFDGKRNIECNILLDLINDGYSNKINQELQCFLNGGYDKKYNFELIDDNKITKSFEDCLKDKDFKNYLIMNIDFCLRLNNDEYMSSNDFILYKKYTRKDVCRLINNRTNEESTIYGYKLYKDKNILPIFINYHKQLEKESTTNYEDAFLSKDLMCWFSKNGMYTNKGQFKEIIELAKKGLRIPLFVCKSNSKYLDDDNQFYYLGDTKLVSSIDTFMLNGKPIVKNILRLENSCREDIYEYIISSID